MCIDQSRRVLYTIGRYVEVRSAACVVCVCVHVMLQYGVLWEALRVCVRV